MAGDQTVEVMTGRNADPNYEMNGRKHRTEMRFADYVDMVYSGKVTNDYTMVPHNEFLQRADAQPLLKDLLIFSEKLDPAAVAHSASVVRPGRHGDPASPTNQN